MCANNRPSAKAVRDNLRKQMPFGKKIGLIIKNTALKIVRFKNCCGNPGEPGC
jgi:hypothetical protein